MYGGQRPAGSTGGGQQLGLAAEISGSRAPLRTVQDADPRYGAGAADRASYGLASDLDEDPLPLGSRQQQQQQPSRGGGYGLEAEELPLGGRGNAGLPPPPRMGGFGLGAEPAAALLPPPRVGGYGLGADVSQAAAGGGYGIGAELSGGGGGYRAPPASGGSEFQGFGLAQETGTQLAGRQTASRVAPQQLDRQADVMTRRGAPPMVRTEDRADNGGGGALPTMGEGRRSGHLLVVCTKKVGIATTEPHGGALSPKPYCLCRVTRRRQRASSPRSVVTSSASSSCSAASLSSSGASWCSSSSSAGTSG